MADNTLVMVAGQDLKAFTKQWSDEVVDLFLSKRQQYGDSFNDSAEAFRHPSDSESQAGLRLFLQREYDKLKRIHQTINSKDNSNADAVVEDALRDIVGYVHVIRSYLLSKQKV